MSHVPDLQRSAARIGGSHALSVLCVGDIPKPQQGFWYSLKGLCDELSVVTVTGKQMREDPATVARRMLGRE